MDCQKKAVVERWPLVTVRLYCHKKCRAFQRFNVVKQLRLIFKTLYTTPAASGVP